MVRGSRVTATPDAPVVYVSPTCPHCRALLTQIKRSSHSDSCRFVNVDEALRLPRFVDRVPLLFDGESVYTDEPLFKLFPMRSKRQSAPHDAGTDLTQDAVAAVDPGPGLGGSFSSAFAGLDGAEAPAGNMWLVDGAHDAIETPECEPMPKKEAKGAS